MTKRALILLAILGLAILVAGFVIFVSPLRSPMAVPVGAASPDIGREFLTEQDWLVASVVRTAAGLAHYARRPGLPVGEVSARVQATGPATVRVDVAAGSETVQDSLALSPFIWSPVPYTSLVRRLLAGTKDLGSTPSSWGVEMLRRLHDPRTEILQEENQRVSTALTAAPADATLHEQAALVLAVLALKEHAGRFHDIRVALSRTTAHLALASALRPDGARRSAEGLVAESVVLALVGRQVQAIAAVRLLAAQVPEDVLTPWVRVVTLRASGDWRLARRVRHTGTLLERLEYFRAVRERLGRSAAVALIEERDPEPIADWTRIIQEEPLSVGAGNRFADLAIDAELDEARALLASYGGGQADEAGLVSRLNDGPAGPLVLSNGAAGIQVIDWGLWAAFLQRHFLVAGNAAMYHYRRMVSLPDEARALEARVEPLMERLTLFPFLARARAGDETTYDASMPGAVLLCARRAELVTPANWRLLLERPAFVNKAWAVPTDTDWFSPSLPFGCVMEVTPRMAGPYCWRALSVPQLAEMRTAAPYDYELAWHYLIEKFSKSASPDIIKSVFGVLMEYDSAAMNSFVKLREDEPADYVPMYARICELLPDTCSTLASYLANRGRDEEAAAVYEDYVRRARDRVGVSNSLFWLVRYYFDTGRSERALELASEAADVYSEAGLSVYGEALERAGRFDEAESSYRAIAARYDDRDTLLAFLLRRRGQPGAERYRDETTTLLAELFGGELQHANATSLRDAPAKGVRVTWRSKLAEGEGVQLDDVVVALDGVRVHTSRQYEIVKSLNSTELRTYTLWRDGQYLDLKVRAPHRWVGLGYEDYTR